MSAEGLQASVEKMRREGVPDAAIASFRHYYEQLDAGESGMVPEDAIEPVRERRRRSTSCPRATRRSTRRS